MGSTRLPGKVMKKIGGKPLIGYMLDRLSYCQNIDNLVLATSDTAENDGLADYVVKLGFDVYRGPEHDVLERFMIAASPYAPTAIVRLTGDCVLIDAEIVDRMIELYERSGADYSWVDSSFAEGLDAEILTFAALRAAHEEATLQSEREHITQFIHKHPSRFRRVPLKNEVNDSAYRIVVDDPEDYSVVSRIVEHFDPQNAGVYFSFAQIKDFLNANPELTSLNSHIVRNDGLIKSLASDKEVK